MPTRLAPASRSIPSFDARAAAPPPTAVAPPPSAPGPVTVPPEEQAVLLRLARAALVAATGQAAGTEPLEAALRAAAGCEARAAVFVTLTEAGDLRGCMGSLIPDRPLREAVVEAAWAAARGDPRFARLGARELPAVRVDISVLGPPVPIRAPADLRPGIDGVIVERGPAVALLLPEVAERLHWGGIQMVEAACRKAGLPASAWCDPTTRLSVFRTAHFGGPALSLTA
jgi:uncharacterized protein